MRWIPGETLEQKIKRVLGENFAYHGLEQNVNTNEMENKEKKLRM